MTQHDQTTLSHHKPHRVLHLSHPDAHLLHHDYPEAASLPLTRKKLAIGFCLSILIAWIGFILEHTYHHTPDAKIDLPWVIPFALLLGAIAIMPFVAKHFWEHNYHRIAVALGLIVAGWYLFKVEHGPGNIGRSTAEYISFIFLLGSLYIVSGGILIRVRARATPIANATLLLIGAVIANIFGTTGASMLLIRPYLRMNKKHLKPYHIVFFIFIVANTGGSLTPIGDPPLFLGYLQGVPFFWVIQNCWPFWVIVNGALILIFLIVDKIQSRKDDRAQYDDDNDLGPSISLYGGANLVFIALILIGILFNSNFNQWTKSTFHFEAPWREMLMAISAAGSLAFTPKRIHGENVFNYGPIREVAYLFIGIFLTMVPALNYLYHNANALPLKTPGQYYFATGTLSGVLDNAPTYLTFLKTELGKIDQTAHEQTDQVETKSSPINQMISNPESNHILIAISMGAVLFGAMTYIGNGPNFMVKSIAENTGASVPGFFGYIFRYSLPILLPILILAWALFLW